GDTAPVARSTGYPSLVNFAPDVRKVGSLGPTWTVPNSQGQGSCTLTCHGFTHLAADTTYLVAPATGFTAGPTSGPVGISGLTVQFTDATRYIDPLDSTWSWDFGDLGTSTLENPLHTYIAAGSYTVTLTVQRTAGNTLKATEVRTDYITVTP
ncbi:MAG: PKD domain-containing protein, partial [Candidatus Limnocylindrales bacterium]